MLGTILILSIPVFICSWFVCNTLLEIYREEKEIKIEKENRRFKNLVREVIEEYNK